MSCSRTKRGTLLKILAKLCPTLSIELFHRLLERYELDQGALISFRQFEEAFTAQPLGTRQPPVIFRGLGASRCISVAHAFKIIQEIACDPSFDLKKVVPPSCFEPNGRVLCPQLRQALGLMRIHLTDENYRRLWRDKFDLERMGSIPTKQLCDLLNLKDDGTPSGHMTKKTALEAAKMQGVSIVNRTPLLVPERTWPALKMLPPSASGVERGAYKLIHELPTAGGSGFPQPTIHSWEPKGPGGSMDPEFGCGDRYQRNMADSGTHQPRFEDVMTCLRYKFETPYQTMMVTFKRFDSKHENRVTQNHCLRILREHGLEIKPDDLDTFLRRILSSSEATGYGFGRDKPPDTIDVGKDAANIRPGLVPYKRLLAYYQDRCKGAPATRIIEDLALRTASDVGIKKVPDLTPDEIGEELVKLLHKDFMRFRKEIKSATQKCLSSPPREKMVAIIQGYTTFLWVRQIRTILECNRYRAPDEDIHYIHQSTSAEGNSASLIDKSKFRDMLNRAIGFSMDDNQWNNLQKYIVYAGDGMINWRTFLDHFSRPSNVASFHTTGLYDPEKVVCPPYLDDYHGEVRDKMTLLRLVEQTIRSKLHPMDKHYKHYDHLKEGMMTKEEFGELLTSHNLDIVETELNYLWALLGEVEPHQTTHHYRQVMAFFYNRTRPIVAEQMRLKRYASIHDPNVEELKKWRESLKQQRAREDSTFIKAAQIVPRLEPRGPVPPRPTRSRLNDLCAKIAPTVLKYWDDIQQAFVQLDNSGATRILWPKFQDVAHCFGFDLTESELTELCRGFDAKERDYVNYFQFMNHFSKTLPKEKAIHTKFDERLYQFNNMKNGSKLSFEDILGEVRNACLSQSRTLHEAYRKMDPKHLGLITIKQIAEVLLKRNIVLSHDDLYHLQTSFDSQMSGFIRYDEFKHTILKSYKPVV